MPIKHIACDNPYIAVGDKCNENSCEQCDWYEGDSKLYKILTRLNKGEQIQKCKAICGGWELTGKKYFIHLTEEELNRLKPILKTIKTNYDWPIYKIKLKGE